MLNCLARRDHSSHELRQKLKAKGFPDEAIRQALVPLMDAGLINEGRFVENYIHWRRNKGFGPQRIALELQARGISAEMIAEHMQITDNTWFVAARKIWKKHFKSKQPETMKDRMKQLRFLQSRGFTREHIVSVFGCDFDE